MTNTATLGTTVPDFTLLATGNQSFTLSNLRGHNLVLYFYPKDSTPGCTIEGQQFRDLHAEFRQLNTGIFGISRDSIKSHDNFKNKQCFPFELLSDPGEIACAVFDVIRMKNMYGKQVRGIERSTFLIDAQGVLRHEWRKVKVDGHAAEVLAAVSSLGSE
ncbi:MAG: peroxiredoxin [Gammaproteobacteria bacterium]|nr:peroxiredoxin [Gammaproteobacteria bacterium]